ncbi:DUF1214 domain-containing protein [Paraburkholderia sp. J67]|uniref:DUF1214 domain-containing protein n=1 Tax=Paraburkholderia sp. J67 TaxID=2805435 RepID=UPI002ABDF11C|nr:DUF1214 domain-containing protein [Paraburkholderia sp. J67]
MKTRMKSTGAALAFVFLATSHAHAQTAAPQATAVTVDNFARAESDKYFAAYVKQGKFGKLVHSRNVARIGEAGVPRPNRDTLYSLGVFDLDAAPLSVTLPDAKRFMELQVINQDHYVPKVVSAPGTFTFTRQSVGTRYAILAVRTLVDPSDPKDLERVHQLQDAIQVNQASVGQFETQAWDGESRKKIHDALLVLGSTLPDFRHAFGTAAEVDPVRHLIATAAAWGGIPDKDAIYLNVTPPRNDGSTRYRLTVKDVPVDGFWSVTVYNGEGHFQLNPYDAYSINNITAKKSDDGSIAIQFGGCDGTTSNCLPVMNGWNYTVRLYRPREEIVKATWTFPEAQIVQ